MQSISKKYARAYLNVFFDELTEKDITAIKQTYEFLEKNKKIIFFLRLPVIEPTLKWQALEIIAQQEHLPASIMVLIKLLLHHKHLELLPAILAAIVRLYQEQAGIMFFTIASSPELTSEEIHALVEFLARRTGRSIIYNYKVDTDLIAGIRLQSTTLLWEHSIRKQLHSITALAHQ